MKYGYLWMAPLLMLLTAPALYAQDEVLPNDNNTPQAPDFASPVDPPTSVQIPKPASPPPPTQPSVQQPTISAPPITPPPTIKQKTLKPRTVPTYE